MTTADTARRKPDASFGSHVKGTVWLGLPLVGAQLAQLSINVADTVLVGQLGAVPLAAAILTTQIFYVVWILGTGFAIAVMPMAAAAEGRGDPGATRRAVRMGLWVVALYSAAVMVPLWFLEPILLAFGQERQVADLSGRYMRVLQWSMLPALAVVVFRSFLAAIERPFVVLAATVAGSALNLVIAYAFIFGRLGAPALGIVGAGVAGLVTMTAIALMLLLYCRREGLRRYELFVRFLKPDWESFADVVRLGLPIGLTMVAEAGLFAASSLMVGRIGAIELAAHGIALQFASIAFMIPLGLASAATVRVGLAYGREDLVAIGRAARAAYAVGLLIAVLAAALFWTAPETLISLYLRADAADSAQVLAAAVPLLLVAAAFQLVDAAQALMGGILRGLKDTRVPMLLAVASYWGLGMPVAYGLAFGLGWGAVGVWWGLAIGLFAAAVLMTRRFLGRERLGILIRQA